MKWYKAGMLSEKKSEAERPYIFWLFYFPQFFPRNLTPSKQKNLQHAWIKYLKTQKKKADFIDDNGTFLILAKNEEN